MRKFKNSIQQNFNRIINHYQRDSWKLAQRSELKILNSVPELLKLNNGNKIDLEFDSKGLLNLYNQKINETEFIHTLSMQNNKDEDILFLHGYGVGLNWLGLGLSSRPNILNLIRNKDIDSTFKMEEFFLNGLEQWRISKNIEQMKLVGHSLGGYLASLYTLKHPDKVKQLILVSPVGIPEKPANIETKNKRIAPKWVNYLWDNHMTPQKIIRSLGPYGENLVSRYVLGRFPNLPLNEQILLKEYLFNLASLPGSGEYALGSILQVGAYARYPLKYRLKNISLPITFIYGDRDWMNPEHAYKIIPELALGSNLKIVPNSGHQLFLDNSPYFNSLIYNELLLN